MKTQKGYLNFIGALCVLFPIVFSNNAWSQISYGGLPYAYSDTLSFKRIKAKTSRDVSVKIKDLDKEMIGRELKEINSCKDCDNGFFYGREVDADIDFLNVAQSVEINDREKLWFLKIESEKSEGYQLIFSKLWLPQGGKLFIYNEDKSMFLGSFTAENNRADSTFVTQYITGHDICVEYLAPKNSENARIYVDKVVYIFDKCFSQNAGPFSGGGGAAECHLNTACSAGKGLDIEIKSTTMILGRAASGSAQYWGICTGTLINDGLNYVAKSNPYLLTANHCYESIDEKTGKQTFNDPKDWLFLFRHEAADCNSDGSDVSNSTTKSVLGAKIIIRDEKSATSDYLLLELNNTVKQISKYDVAFAGYDYDVPFTPPGSIAFPLTGIHHPKGDVKKLMVFFSPAETTNWNNKPGNDYWKVTSAKGFKTEPGSSGSALFDSKHRVIGICRGGDNAITCSSDRNLFQTFYGKLSEANKKWDLISYLPFIKSEVYVPPIEKPSEELSVNASVNKNEMTIDYPYQRTLYYNITGDYIRGKEDITINFVVYRKPFDNTIYGPPFDYSDSRYVYSTITTRLGNSGIKGEYIIPSFSEVGEYKLILIAYRTQSGNTKSTTVELKINITPAGICECGTFDFREDVYRKKYAPGSYVRVVEATEVLNRPADFEFNNPNPKCYSYPTYKCEGWQPKYAGVRRRIWKVDGDTALVEHFNTAREYSLFNPGVFYTMGVKSFKFTTPGVHVIDVLLNLALKYVYKNEYGYYEYCCFPPKPNTYFKLTDDSDPENAFSGRLKIIVADCDGSRTVYKENSPMLSVLPSEEKEIGAGTVNVMDVTLLEGKRYAVEAYKNIILKSGTLIKRGSSFCAKIIPCPAITPLPPYLYPGEVIESVVAVSEKIAEPVSDNHIVVYPNPSNGVVNVGTNGIAAIRKLEVYDLNGKIVESRSYVFSNPYALDLSGLSGGIYVLKVYSSLGVDIHKIMINK